MTRTLNRNRSGRFGANRLVDAPLLPVPITANLVFDFDPRFGHNATDGNRITTYTDPVGGFVFNQDASGPVYTKSDSEANGRPSTTWAAAEGLTCTTPILTAWPATVYVMAKLGGANNGTMLALSDVSANNVYNDVTERDGETVGESPHVRSRTRNGTAIDGKSPYYAENGIYRLAATWKATNRTIRINNGVEDSLDSASQTWNANIDQTTIGHLIITSSSVLRFTGKIFRILVYSAEHTNAQRGLIDNYLARLYLNSPHHVLSAGSPLLVPLASFEFDTADDHWGSASFRLPEARRVYLAPAATSTETGALDRWMNTKQTDGAVAVGAIEHHPTSDGFSGYLERGSIFPLGGGHHTAAFRSPGRADVLSQIVLRAADDVSRCVLLADTNQHSWPSCAIYVGKTYFGGSEAFFGNRTISDGTNVREHSFAVPEASYGDNGAHYTSVVLPATQGGNNGMLHLKVDQNDGPLEVDWYDAGDITGAPDASYAINSASAPTISYCQAVEDSSGDIYAMTMAKISNVRRGVVHRWTDVTDGANTDTLDVVLGGTGSGGVQERYYILGIKHYESGSDEVIGCSWNRAQHVPTIRKDVLAGIYVIAGTNAGKWQNLDGSLVTSATLGDGTNSRFTQAHEDALVSASGIKLTDTPSPVNTRESPLFNLAWDFTSWPTKAKVAGFVMHNTQTDSDVNSPFGWETTEVHTFAWDGGTEYDHGRLELDTSDGDLSGHYTVGLMYWRDDDPSTGELFFILFEREDSRPTDVFGEQPNQYHQWGGNCIRIYKSTAVYSATPGWTLVYSEDMPAKRFGNILLPVHGQTNRFVYHQWVQGQSHEWFKQGVPTFIDLQELGLVA